MSEPQPTSQASPAFVTTRWTQVLHAKGDTPSAQAALGELCEAYWMPVFRFIRRSGHGEDESRDLTQEFFAQLLRRHGLDRAEPSRGRFRSYLLGAVRHFLANQWDRSQASKRGGGCVAEPLPLGGGGTTTVVQVADPAAAAPVAFFDRHWALTVMDRALKALAAEMAAAGKQEQFEVLKPWLAGDAECLSQAEAGRKLGMSECAVGVSIHRLRKQFRNLVKGEIFQTIADPAEVQGELNYLVEALLAGGS
jgi:RNA polymerase sigma-70 factor (ECF subfamily)